MRSVAWGRIVLLVLTLSCTDSALGGGGPGDSGEPGPGDVAAELADEGRDDDPGPGEGTFSVPAASGSFAIDFGIGIDGAGTGRIGAIDIDTGAGTVVVDGTSLPVAVYQRQEWTAFGYTLYQGLAVASDRWYLLWFYCRGGSLTDIYYEGTAGGSMELAGAGGECTESAEPSTVTVSYPASELVVDHQMDGFAVSGEDVELNGVPPEQVEVDSATFDVTVFNRVDCTVECGQPGWHELHALLWDAEREWLSFAIFYLFADQRPVLLTYAFALPALQPPFGTVSLPATWTGP